MTPAEHIARAEEAVAKAERVTVGSPFHTGHMLTAIAHATIAQAQGPARPRPRKAAADAEA